jgi:hypothetical protein
MESVETLNERLIDYFGRDTVTGQAMFRISYSDEQYEMRLCETTESGIQLIFPVVRLAKKYPYIKSMYVLERLVVVPEVNQPELPASKLSYEPLWTYCDDKRNSLPPVWPVTQFAIDTLYAALGKTNLAKYVEPTETRDERIQKIQEELFGNETDVSDALTYKEGIVVPSNYNKES